MLVKIACNRVPAVLIRQNVFTQSWSKGISVLISPHTSTWEPLFIHHIFMFLAIYTLNLYKHTHMD